MPERGVGALVEDLDDLDLEACARLVGAVEGFYGRVLVSSAIEAAADAEDQLGAERERLAVRFEALRAGAAPEELAQAEELRVLCRYRTAQSFDLMGLRAFAESLRSGGDA